ncbi:MAG: YggT family protein [Candidatus Bipolaricaulaceae bacterium]
MVAFIVAVARLVEATAWAYSLVVVGRAVVSWLPLQRDHPLRRCLEAATEPLLGPIRHGLIRLGLSGPVDWSPLILLLAVYLLRDLLVRGLFRLAALL